MPLWSAPAPLVLASRSFARRNMLGAAGIPIEIIAASIDERAIERTLGADRDPDRAAPARDRRSRAAALCSVAVRPHG